MSTDPEATAEHSNGLPAGSQANAEHQAPGLPAEESQLSYETATARVEEIIRRLDSGEASLSETLELVREGKTLIERCAGELEAVGSALEELRLDELVSRLEADGAA